MPSSASGPSDSWLRHARAGKCAAVIVVLLASASAALAPAQGATGSTVVSATVPSATSVNTAGCLPGVAGRTDFGSVLPGTTTLTTDDCSIVFGSSNDTAALRIAQGDAAGMAMAGAPDRRLASWATSGASTLAVSSFNALGGLATVLQPDGKTVVAGCAYAGSNVSAIYRLNADGSLDTAGFNAPNGYVTLDIAPSATECLQHLAIQADGKIVAVGYAQPGGSTQDATIMRVNADGTVDTAFGGSGTGVRVEDLGGPGNGEAYRGVVVQPGGTIVAAGNDDPSGIDDRWVFGQYLSDGTPDASVGGGTGRVTYNPSPNQDRLFEFVIDPRGGYLSGGQVQPSSLEGGVVRLTAALTPDTTWGASGFRMINVVSSYETVVQIRPQPDGSALLAVENSGASPNRAIVAKLTASGGLDTAGFAAPNGFIVLPGSANNVDYTRSIVVGPTQHVYVLFNNMGIGSRLGRLTSAGVLDTSFGTGGVTAVDATTTPMSRSLHMIGSTLQFSAQGSAIVNDRTVRYGGDEVDDYTSIGVGTDRDWNSGTGTNLFGVCLRALAGSTADWTADADADCTATDTDPWRSIPATTGLTAAQVAHTTSTGSSSTASLRFGFRPATNLRPGRYEAPIIIEVVAPG